MKPAEHPSSWRNGTHLKISSEIGKIECPAVHVWPVISPTAHREIHHGAEGAKLDKKLAELIAQKEALLDSQG